MKKSHMIERGQAAQNILTTDGQAASDAASSRRLPAGLAITALAAASLLWLWSPSADGQPASPALPASLAGPAAARVLSPPSSEPQPLPKPHFMDDPAAHHIKALYPPLPPLDALIGFTSTPNAPAAAPSPQLLPDPFELPRSLKINTPLPEPGGWVPPLTPPVRVGP